jgi:hypothetical protein
MFLIVPSLFVILDRTAGRSGEQKITPRGVIPATTPMRAVHGRAAPAWMGAIG